MLPQQLTTTALLYRDERQEGPYTFQQLNEFLVNGTITSQDLLWMEGWTAWKPLSEVMSPPEPINNSSLGMPQLDKVADIYLNASGKPIGPFTLDQINSQLDQKQIQTSDLAWKLGSPAWMSVSSLSGVVPSTLFPTLPTSHHECLTEQPKVNSFGGKIPLAILACSLCVLMVALLCLVQSKSASRVIMTPGVKLSDITPKHPSSLGHNETSSTQTTAPALSQTSAAPEAASSSPPSNDSDTSAPPQETAPSSDTNTEPKEADQPADPGNKVANKLSFKIVQVLSPGRALAQEILQYDEGTNDQLSDKTYLLSGIPTSLVDGDTWSGWVFQGDNFTYTGTDQSANTVRTFIVSLNQAPANVKVTARLILDDGAHILKIMTAYPDKPDANLGK